MTIGFRPDCPCASNPEARPKYLKYPFGTIASAAQGLVQAPSTLNFIALFRRVGYEAATRKKNRGTAHGAAEVTRRRVVEYA